MSKQWHKGPPPSVGWWPASGFRYCRDFRWWDGKQWSITCYPEDRPDIAARYAAIPAHNQDEIEWTDRPDDWPARSKT